MVLKKVNEVNKDNPLDESDISKMVNDIVTSEDEAVDFSFLNDLHIDAKDVKDIKRDLKKEKRIGKLLGQMKPIVQNLIKKEVDHHAIIKIVLEVCEHYFTKRGSGELKKQICVELLKCISPDLNLLGIIIESNLSDITKTNFARKNRNRIVKLGKKVLHFFFN